MRKATALWLILILALTAGSGLSDATPTPRPFEEPVEGSVRVLLQSLGSPKALGMTLDGAYSVDGDRGFQFDPGTEIALGIDGGHVLLKVGGASIDMGGGFTLERHLDDTGNAGGVYIHESEKDTLYAGDVNVSVEHESLRVTVTLGIEEYLYGVVPYEMSDTFPMEALKAQAVAARTYAMQRKTRNAGKAYDVVDTANDQVYKGLDTRFEKPIQAVVETNGLVGMHDGGYAECFYSASNGGQTALASDVWGEGSFGYLDMRDDPYDLENPQSITKTATVSTDVSLLPDALRLPLEEGAQAALLESGDIREGEKSTVTGIQAIEAVQPIYGGESRQYGTVRFTVTCDVERLAGEEGETFRMAGETETLKDPVTVDLSFYDQVRQALGIGINASRYELLTIEEAEDGFLFATRRYGHGVGLSQRGAEWMAEAYGMNHLDILSFYYPGLELVQMAWTEKPLTPADELPESLGYAAPRPTPAPTPGPLPPVKGDEYYATVIVEGVDSTLNIRQGPSTEDRIVGVIRNGARMIIEEELEEGWAKMRTAELEGYVLMNFIAKEEP